MSEELELPTLENSGSSGTQEVATENLELPDSKPLEGLLLAKTIDGLASSHSRSLGGDVASALIAGATNQISSDLQELKIEHKLLKERFDQKRNELETCRTERAVLKERIRSEGKNKHLRNLAISIGTSLIGVGVYLSRTQMDKYAWGAYGCGVIMVFLAWISGPKETEK